MTSTETARFNTEVSAFSDNLCVQYKSYNKQPFTYSAVFRLYAHRVLCAVRTE